MAKPSEWLSASNPASTPINFNFELHFKEINERFARLIKQLGSANKRGSPRYKFEVDFAHALNEISSCPKYLQGKMFDEASKIVNDSSDFIKAQQEVTSEAT